MSRVPPQADVVAKRRDVLTALSTPMTKPQLVAALDTSRSTVDRAIGDLRDHGFVERQESEYIATYAGRQAVAAYDGFLDRLDALGTAQPLLEALPHSVDLPPAVLDGATVYQSTPEAPERPVEQTVGAVVGATAFCGTAPAIVSRYIDVFEALADDGTDIELVVTEAVLDTLSETYADGLETIDRYENITLYVTDVELLYAVWTSERPGRTVSGLIVYGESGLVGILYNDTAAMNEWVRGEYERIRAGADPFD